MPDPIDDLFDNGDDGDAGAGDGAPAGGSSTDPKDPKSTEKRIRDLQSKADTETARANKAETRLKALEAALKTPDSGDGKPPAGGNVSNDMVLDMARMFAVQQNPKLAEYGLSESDLSGSTPSEIARSAVELVARFEKIETQVRNKVLAANGLSPEVDSGGPPAPSRDYSKMSSEDFKKVMDAAMSRR